MADQKPTVAFPEVTVRLLSGKEVEIKPWSLKQGRLIRRKITGIVDALQTAGKNVSSLTDIFDLCEDQVIEIIRDTLRVDDEWMEANVAYEDVYSLAQAVVEVCLMRGGKDGVMGKVMAALGKQPEAEIEPGLKQRLAEVRALSRSPEPQTPSETIAL
jgi:hypothetical protein